MCVWEGGGQSSVMVGGGPPWCGSAHQRALPTCDNLNLTSNITMSVVAEKERNRLK